ncbi:MAG: A/G-specific adenine glycosylase [Clostridia bacterium]|nr:A/G-specific adenine glycosylase [Clostridia bacterium]
MPLYETLLRWYDQNKREFVFRGTRDPYQIWLSEIMLQQTRTETVVPYFERFTALFPTVEALACAQEEEVLLAWQGLGYYSRARNLHAAAKKVWFELGGQFPRTVEGLLTLPGVGPYTAAAIASIAFDVPAPAMDGNLTRVFSRIHGIRENVEIPSVKRRLHEIAAGEMPPKRAGDFNQALMDLGATICTPGTPDCERCPMQKYCTAYADGDADMLPVKSVKKAPKQVEYAVLLITCKNRILMMQRKENLLKNLWVFPMEENTSPEDIVSRLPRGHYSAPRFLGEGKHVFTHLIWQMKIYHLEADAMFDAPHGQWVTADEMDKLPKPTAIRSALKYAQNLPNHTKG